MKKFKIELALLAALILRLVIAPLGRHSDCDNTFHWAKYLWDKKDFFEFLGKAVPDAMPAFYPPIFYYLIFLWRGIYEFIGRVLWWINLKIPIFPSNLIFWYQSYQGGVAFNKLLAIFADFVCAFLIYKISLLIGCRKKLASVAMLLFLLLPPFWYNSAHWGQDESLYCLFLLLAFFFVFKDRYLWAILTFVCSLLVKQSGLAVLPVFFVFVIRKKKIVDILLAGFFSAVLMWILYFPFHPLNTLFWATEFYFRSLRGEINYLVCNAFNFWALIFGFEQRSANLIYLGQSLTVWSFIILGVFLIAILFRLWQKPTRKRLVWAALLSSFAAFLFLTKMHERYLYTSLIFLAILAGLNKKMIYYFVLLSLIHQINLYHFWWSPKIYFLIMLFSNLAVIRIIIFLNILIFAKLFVNYFKDEIT